jgi:hypothetical protein
MTHSDHPHRQSGFVRGFRKFKHWLKQKALEASLTDWLMAIFTCAIVYLAWSSGKQTDKMIVAADKSAAAAQSFSQTADKIQAETQSAVTEFGAMANANRKSADAASESSNTAKAALEISERAYVGVTSAELDRDIAEGQDSKLNVTIANGGRTPAFSVHVRHYYRWGPKDIQTKLTFGKLDVISTSILLPNVQLISASDKIPGPALLAPMIALLKAGAWVLVSYGDITYTDVVRKTRLTRYCYLYDPANPIHLQVCAQGNVAN